MKEQETKIPKNVLILGLVYFLPHFLVGFCGQKLVRKQLFTLEQSRLSFHFLSFLLVSFGKKFNIMRLNKRLIFYLALTFMPLGNGLANPSIQAIASDQAIASENVPKEEYGGTLGLLQSVGFLGRILGPIIGGELFYHFGKDIPFLFTSVILFFVFLSNLKLKDKLFYHPPLDRNGRI